MGWFSSLVFGKVKFEASEEYLEFQYNFLCIVILAGAVLTGLLVLGSHSAASKIDPVHVRSMTIITIGSIAFWLVLRGRKAWFLKVGWPYVLLHTRIHIGAVLRFRR